MRYLLDTHSLIWFFAGDLKLSEKAKELIENEDNIKYISLASVWEMGIKQSKKKLTLAYPLEEYIERKLDFQDFQLLPITLKHLGKITTLPSHHNDPFDRLLIAQAMIEQVPIISVDGVFNEYEINCIW